MKTNYTKQLSWFCHKIVLKLRIIWETILFYDRSIFLYQFS